MAGSPVLSAMSWSAFAALFGRNWLGPGPRPVGIPDVIGSIGRDVGASRGVS